MVDIFIRGGTAVFEPRGWHKLWTLRRRIEVPLSAIRTVRRAPPDVASGLWHGWRLPGTQVPGVIIAGSYLRDGSWTFWDVRGKGGRAVEITLSGERYERMVIDVENPAAVVTQLHAAVARRGAVLPAGDPAVPT